MLSRSVLGALVLVALASPAVGQVSKIFDRNALGESLAVSDYTVQSIPVEAEPGLEVVVPVVIDGQAVTLALFRNSVRSSKYQLLVQGEDGRLRKTAPGPETTFEGMVLEVPGSRVAANIIDGQLDALIRLGDGLPTWGIQPVGHEAGLAPDDHAVYSSAELIDLGYSCGGAVGTLPAEHESHLDLGRHDGKDDPVENSFDPAKVCEIACDADVQFYNVNGSSVVVTENDITNIINRCEIIYLADANIEYEITTIIVRTAEPDPYTTSSPGGLLSQFESEWINNQGGIQRDIAHLFTGRDLSGTTIGIANLNAICSFTNGYGLSQSRFTSNLTFRTGLTAHELGHNWRALHCDGQGDCGIMCSGIGGCTGVLTAFGNSSISSILAEKRSSGCLSDAVPPPVPQINSLNPNNVGALGTEQVTIFGSSFTTVTEVNAGGVIIPSGGLGAFTIIDDTEIRFPAPDPTALGPVSVTVTNPGGTSNAGSYTVVEEVPPVYTGSTLVIPIVSPQADFTGASLVSHSAFWIITFDGTTGIHKGFELLAFPLAIVPVPLNALGVVEFSLPIGTDLSGMGIQFFTQMAFFNPGLQHISNVVTTAIF